MRHQDFISGDIYKIIAGYLLGVSNMYFCLKNHQTLIARLIFKFIFWQVSKDQICFLGNS